MYILHATPTRCGSTAFLYAAARWAGVGIRERLIKGVYCRGRKAAAAGKGVLEWITRSRSREDARDEEVRSVHVIQRGATWCGYSMSTWARLINFYGWENSLSHEEPASLLHYSRNVEGLDATCRCRLTALPQPDEQMKIRIRLDWTRKLSWWLVDEASENFRDWSSGVFKGFSN